MIKDFISRKKINTFMINERKIMVNYGKIEDLNTIALRYVRWLYKIWN